VRVLELYGSRRGWQGQQREVPMVSRGHYHHPKGDTRAD